MSAKVHKPASPVLFEETIAEIQDALAAKVTWLGNIFGKAQKMLDTVEGKRKRYPAVYDNMGNNQYENMLPDSEYNNYCFFVLGDEQEILPNSNPRHPKLKTEIGIIFWFDLEQILVANDRRLEQVKKELVEVLSNLTLTTGSIVLSKIHEDADNIFKEFDINELEATYLMQPHAGLRFNGEIVTKTKNQC